MDDIQQLQERIELTLLQNKEDMKKNEIRLRREFTKQAKHTIKNRELLVKQKNAEVIAL